MIFAADPQALAADVVDRVGRAAIAAKAGRADEAQGLLGGIAFEHALHMPDELLAGIGQCHYLSGNARSSVQWLRAVRRPDAVCRMALSAALTASGRTIEAGIEHRHAMAAPDALGVQHAEDLLSDDEPTGYRLPQGAWRGWGAANYALARGDWDAARDDYAAKCAQMPAFAIGADVLKTRSGQVPRWKGEHCDRLVLVCPDGYGDVFLFGRFLRQMRECCTDLVLLAQKPVVTLVKHSAPWVSVYSFDSAEAALRGADRYAYSWLLPSVLRTHDEAQWLSADGKVDLGPGRHIGIVWSGSGVNRYDSLRSIPVAEMAPLFGVPGVTWHSLTVGPRASEECQAGAIDHNDELRAGGFLQTARLIAGLDLVVSIDSSVANLCGAMGVPVWAIVESDPDFRWGTADLHGERSPWYPSARVFRQAKGEGWASVAERLSAALGGCGGKRKSAALSNDQPGFCVTSPTARLHTERDSVVC